jgi:TolA-binding protein
MAIRDEIKTNLDKVTESTAFYAVAGAGDLAAEKLRQVPVLFAELDLPGRIDELQQRLDKLQGKLSELRVEAVDVQAKAQSKARELPERFTDLAMQLTGMAVQTYGELAQRGKTVVDRRRGISYDDLPIKTEVVREPITPVVEQVTSAPETKPVAATKPVAKKTTAAKSTTARKTTSQSRAKSSPSEPSKS